MSEDKKYEIVEYKGQEARYYPGSGAYMSVATGIILGNEGGNPQMQTGTFAADMARKKAVMVREAIIQGLADAATSLEDVPGDTPTDMLAEIVKARAITASSSSGKAGNDAARFIFSIVGATDEEGGQQSAAMEVKMSPEMAKYVMDKMIEDK